MEIKKAVEGLLLSKGADGTSPHTIKVYQYGLKKFINFIDSSRIEDVKKQDIERFFLYLRQESGLQDCFFIVSQNSR